MASDKQITANRDNATKSTGPRTEAGKQVSRRNAFKHGLTAKTIVVADEDAEKFVALRAQLEHDYQPQTALERILTELIAADMLRLLRIPVFEAAFMDFFYKEALRIDKQNRLLLSDPFGLGGDDDAEDSETPTIRKMATWLSQSEGFQIGLARLSRYQAALMNSFNRNLKQLMTLIVMRQKQQEVAA